MANLALQGLSKQFNDGQWLRSRFNVAGRKRMGRDGDLPDTRPYAVDRVDLEIEHGRLLVVLGPSGSGKTTLLRLVAGLERPTSGTIRLDGQDVTTSAARQRNVALAFQDGLLYPHLSVAGNLAFRLRLRRSCGGRARSLGQWTGRLRSGRGESARIARRVRRAARTLDIEHLLDRSPQSLSGGERQRVALGRAIVRRSAAFLLDEPLAGLDGPLRAALQQRLVTWQRRHRATVVWVTHDQAEALAVADQVLVMREGKREQFGTPRQVYDEPENVFVASFVGAPPMNLLRGHWRIARGVQPLGAPSGSGQVRPTGESSWVTWDGSGWQWSWRAAGDARGSQVEGRPRSEQPVVLGMRPDRLKIVAARGDAMPWSDEEHARSDVMANGGRTDVIDGRTARADQWARVTDVRWMGDVTWLRLQPELRVAERSGKKASAEELLVAESGRARVGRGDRVSVEVDVRDMHWFDGQTGRRL